MRTLLAFCLVLALSYADQRSSEEDSGEYQHGNDIRAIWPPPALSYNSVFEQWGRGPVPMIMFGVAFLVCELVIFFFSFVDGKILSGQNPGRSDGSSLIGQGLNEVWHLTQTAIEHWAAENEGNQ